MSRRANITRRLVSGVVNIHAAALVRVSQKASEAEQKAWREYDDAVEMSRVMNENKRRAKAAADAATRSADDVHFAVNVELANLPFLQGSDKL